MTARRSCMTLIFLTFALSGCFSYVPAEIETVPVGARVRALLTPAGQERLRTIVGFERDAITGKVVQKQANSVRFSVRSVRGSESGTGSDLVQHIDVPHQDVARTDLKKIDGLKTGAVIAAVSGLFSYVAIRAAGGETIMGGTPGTSGPDESIRFPFLMLRFYLPH